MPENRLLSWVGAAAIVTGALGEVRPCGEPLFPAQQFELAHPPRAIAAADFDRDGSADLAVLHYQVSAFSLLRGEGEGLLAAPVEFPLPSPGRALVAADLDGDGDADLAATTYGLPPDYNGAVLVVPGDGKGSFSGAVAFPAGPYPSALAIGDLDGDGDPDLVVINASSEGAVAVLLNDGAGAFGEPINRLVPGGPVSVAIGEFNGDGDRDLAVASASADAVSILLGNGDGTFDPPALVPTGGLPKAAIVEDFNGDGRDDVAATAFYEGAVYLHLGDGSGGFAAPMTFPAGTSLDALVAGDLDGDHDADLVVLNNDYVCIMFGSQFCVGVMRNLGGGIFEPFEACPVGGEPVAVAIADLTGDGRADLAVATQDVAMGVTVLRGRGDATFETAVVLPPWEAKSFRLAVADLNDDGNMDLVGTYVVRLGNGDGTFSAPLPYPPNWTTDLAVADLTGDGIMDLALALNKAWHVVTLRGIGDGSFVSPDNWVTAGECRRIIAVDFDGDGDDDLAVTAFHPLTPHLSLLFNDGAGNFTEPVQYQVGSNPIHIAGGDLDGDGDADLAISDGWSETVWLTFNNGFGAFSAPVAHDLVQGDTTDIAIGDLDLDGRSDLVVSMFVYPANKLAVFINQGGGSFADPVYLDAGLGGGDVTIGDVNRDGLPDFVLGSIAIMLGAGGGAFGPPFAFGGFAGGDVGLVDIDHDGDMDVASNGARTNLFVNNMCPAADLDGNGAVGIVDFLLLLMSWGPCPGPCPPYCGGDMDGDCDVGFSDFLALLAGWG